MKPCQAVCADVDAAAVLVGFVCFLRVGAVHDRAALLAQMRPCGVDVEVSLEQPLDVGEQLPVGVANGQFASMYASFPVEEGSKKGSNTVLAVLNVRFQLLQSLLQELVEQATVALHKPASLAPAPPIDR